MLTLLQIIVAVILIVLVLLQERGGGLGALGGGGGTGMPYETRRGVGRLLFWGTVIAAILFVVLSVLNLVD